jgi:hypothetical protein
VRGEDELRSARCALRTRRWHAPAGHGCGALGPPEPAAQVKPCGQMAQSAGAEALVWSAKRPGAQGLAFGSAVPAGQKAPCAQGTLSAAVPVCGQAQPAAQGRQALVLAAGCHVPAAQGVGEALGAGEVAQKAPGGQP